MPLHEGPIKCARGEIYVAEVLEPETRGSEQRKKRCWVVLSSKTHVNSRYPIIIGVPLSESAKCNSPTRVEIGAEDIHPDPRVRLADCVALTEQIRVLSVERIVARHGVLRPEALMRIEMALRLTLELH